MTILNPITMLFHLIHLGISIMAFFLVVRLILTWKRFGWLEAFDKAGGSLVNGMTTAVGDCLSRGIRKKISDRGRLLVSLAILTLADLVLVCLTNATV